MDEGVNLWFAAKILKLLRQGEDFNGAFQKEWTWFFVTPFQYPNSTLFRKIFYCDSDIIFEYKPGS